MPLDMITGFDHLDTTQTTIKKPLIIPTKAINVHFESSYVTPERIKCYPRKLATPTDSGATWLTYERSATGANDAYLRISSTTIAAAYKQAGSRVILGFRLYVTGTTGTDTWLMFSATSVTTTTSVASGVALRSGEEVYIEIVYDALTATTGKLSIYVNSALTTTMNISSTNWCLQVGETNGRVMGAIGGMMAFKDVYVSSSLPSEQQAERLNSIAVHKTSFKIDKTHWLQEDAQVALDIPVKLNLDTVAVMPTPFVPTNATPEAITITPTPSEYQRIIGHQLHLYALAPIKDQNVAFEIAGQRGPVTSFLKTETVPKALRSNVFAEFPVADIELKNK